MDDCTTLKQCVRLLLLEAMKRNNKINRDIVNSTDHSAAYVSKMLSEDCNLSLDTVENIFNAIGFKVDITITPKDKSFSFEQEMKLFWQQMCPMRKKKTEHQTCPLMKGFKE